MLASNLLRVSVVIILVGMAMGMAMGIAQDFRLMAAHAHLNLLGFVSLFLAGLYYQAVPEAAGSKLAVWQASIAVLGALVFPIGICIVLLYGPSYEIYPIGGSIVAFIGMLLFAVVVFRYGAPKRA
jgi:peptidoglycan/LPS O-acetylase OafA/YrhL